MTSRGNLVPVYLTDVHCRLKVQGGFAEEVEWNGLTGFVSDVLRYFHNPFLETFVLQTNTGGTEDAMILHSRSTEVYDNDACQLRSVGRIKSALRLNPSRGEYITGQGWNYPGFVGLIHVRRGLARLCCVSSGLLISPARVS